MAASPFRPALDLMVQYARYHRDRRNIATHFIGIPLIVFAIGVLMGRAQFSLVDLSLSAAWLFWAITTLWYLSRGALLLGAATAAVNGVLIALAAPLASHSLSSASWLAWGVGSFVVGWVFQFVGHYYEGKKPAFVDDLVGLLVGPMFVVGEALFALGLQRGMLAEIERQAGPTHLRDLTRPAA